MAWRHNVSDPSIRERRLHTQPRLSLSVGYYKLCRDDIGVLWKAPQAEPRHNLNPVTTLWHEDIDKRARDRQMLCKRLQPSHRPSANSLTLVPAGTTEYIAAGDSQAIAKPLFLSPQKSEGISTFSERRLQVFPLCCYSLAVTAGK